MAVSSSSPCVAHTFRTATVHFMKLTPSSSLLQTLQSDKYGDAFLSSGTRDIWGDMVKHLTSRILRYTNVHVHVHVQQETLHPTSALATVGTAACEWELRKTTSTQSSRLDSGDVTLEHLCMTLSKPRLVLWVSGRRAASTSSTARSRCERACPKATGSGLVSAPSHNFT